jgi:CRP-like cAMP-binding protein
MSKTKSTENLFKDWEPSDTRHFSQREFIFRQGDPVRYLFAVGEGQVRLERNTVEGRQVVLHTTDPGQSFSEAALFSDIYHCNAVASLPSRILLYPRDKVLKTLRDDWQAAERFMAILSGQVRTLRTRLELRNILSARDRILQYLLLRASQSNSEINLKHSFKHLASELGLAHETLYREMAALEQEGIIKRDGRQITILTGNFK